MFASRRYPQERRRARAGGHGRALMHAGPMRCGGRDEEAPCARGGARRLVEAV